MTQVVTSQAANRILVDESASEWLKQTLQSALKRDPVDALNDALALADVLEDHLRTTLDIDRSS